MKKVLKKYFVLFIFIQKRIIQKVNKPVSYKLFKIYKILLRESFKIIA